MRTATVAEIRKREVSNKFQKRIRARMKKTGETYQAAYQALDQDREPTILEFLEPFVRPYPVQRIVLKLLYGLPLDDTATFEFHDALLSGEKVVHTEKSYVRFLHANGRCNLLDVEPGHEHKQFVFVTGRRAGKSVIQSWVVAYELWRVLNWPEKKNDPLVGIGVLGHCEDQARLLRDQIEYVVNKLKGLHEHRRTHTQNWSKYTREKHPDPQSRAKAVVKYAKASRHALHGMGTYLATIDEYAFIQNPQETYDGILPTLAHYENSKLLACSTPNGFNDFYSLFMQVKTNPEKGLVLQLPTWEINPTISLESLRSEKERDPFIFWQEYGAEFLEDEEEEDDVVAQWREHLEREQSLKEKLTSTYSSVEEWIEALQACRETYGPNGVFFEAYENPQLRRVGIRDTLATGLSFEVPLIALKAFVEEHPGTTMKTIEKLAERLTAGLDPWPKS